MKNMKKERMCLWDYCLFRFIDGKTNDTNMKEFMDYFTNNLEGFVEPSATFYLLFEVYGNAFHAKENYETEYSYPVKMQLKSDCGEALLVFRIDEECGHKDICAKVYMTASRARKQIPMGNLPQFSIEQDLSLEECA